MTRTKSFDLVRAEIEANGDALYHAYIRLDKHTVKKNSRPIFRNRSTGRAFIGKSQGLHSAEAHLISEFRRAILRKPNFKEIDQPIWCVFLFYFKANDFVVKQGPRRGRLSQRIPDLSNLVELPADCLTKAGIISDDHLICSLDLSRRLPAEHCALEVFIFRYALDLQKPVALVRDESK